MEENEIIEERTGLIKNALGCTPEEFYKRYTKYKKAEAEFNEIYEPFKEKLIGLHKDIPDLQNSIFVNSVKLTYVAPTTRASIDTKKLKEEEPEIAKKFTRTSEVKATVRIDGI